MLARGTRVPGYCTRVLYFTSKRTCWIQYHAYPGTAVLEYSSTVLCLRYPGTRVHRSTRVPRYSTRFLKVKVKLDAHVRTGKCRFISSDKSLSKIVSIVQLQVASFKFRATFRNCRVKRGSCQLSNADSCLRAVDLSRCQAFELSSCHAVFEPRRSTP